MHNIMVLYDGEIFHRFWFIGSVISLLLQVQAMVNHYRKVKEKALICCIVSYFSKRKFFIVSIMSSELYFQTLGSCLRVLRVATWDLSQTSSWQKRWWWWWEGRWKLLPSGGLSNSASKAIWPSGIYLVFCRYCQAFTFGCIAANSLVFLMADGADFLCLWVLFGVLGLPVIIFVL